MVWSWQPTTITPTGYGISGGDLETVEGYSRSRSKSYLKPQSILQPSLISNTDSVGTINVNGWGTRSGYSRSKSSCGVDIGRGLTVINETGVISTDTNVLRFYGDTLKSGQHPTKGSDVIVTTGCVTLNGSGGDVLQGGEGSDISGGACYEDTNLDITVYTQRVDLVTDYLIYKGWALAGSLESDVVWRIQKILIDEITGDVTKIFADGNTDFDNVWNDRLSYNYF